MENALSCLCVTHNTEYRKIPANPEEIPVAITIFQFSYRMAHKQKRSPSFESARASY
jgi:hypothetical protein